MSYGYGIRRNFVVQGQFVKNVERLNFVFNFNIK